MRNTAIAGLGLAALLLSTEAQASKFVFPYHHPDLDWYTIETDHFFVHYPVSKRTADDGNKHYVNAEFMAKRTAKVSEEMWEPMCAEFDYYLTEKVHIVLLDQSDDLEGFTIPAWNWIEISGNPGGYFYRMRGRMEWFSDVLVHEFAHVVSLKRNNALGEGVGALAIGGLVRDGYNDQETGVEITIGSANEPFWWSEGGAEYWSDQTGYNWWTSSRDANIRTTVLEDRLLTYDEWVTRLDKRDWGDGERGYQQGYSFGLYLRERFGDDLYAQMSMESGKKWRANWEGIIKDLTGFQAEQLYDDWVVYLEKKYGETHARVIAEGETVGGELETSTGDWVVRDPDARDAWLKQDNESERKRRADREGDKHATGTWDFYPKMSDDGKWIGEHTAQGGGMVFLQYPEEMIPALAGQEPDPAAAAEAGRIAADSMVVAPFGSSSFGHGFDFVPGRDQAVVSGNEDMIPRGPAMLRVETDGYNWGQLWLVDLTAGREEKRKHRGGKETYEVHTAKHVANMAVLPPDQMRKIPNTERSADPAVSPDGTRVAYFEYGDGTLNLITINLDGTDKKRLTSFDDGTWLQNVDWSPDGTQLVFSMLRNFRQDLYVVDADGTGTLTALNRDEWEDQDAFWSKDGSIYFSSDPTGIFNIFRYDPEAGTVTQVTNVIGGAECPWITPQGNLLYTDMTAHGWKNKVLAGDELFEKDVTALFDFTPDSAEVAADLAHVEDLSAFSAKAEKYPFLGSWMPPTFVPILRFENDSRTNFALSFGGQLYAQDLIEDHVIFAQAMAGEDPLVLAGYTWNGWYPSISVLGYHYEGKVDYAFLLDDDGDTTTTDDQTTFEGKQNQFTNVARVDIEYPINGNVSATLFAGGFQFGFRGSSDLSFQPFLVGNYSGLRLFYSTRGSYVGNANLRSARVIDVSYQHGYSDLVYKPYAGRDTDDGMVLDDYQYNKVEARWTEHMPLPTFWGNPLFKKLRDHQHSLQFDGQMGLIDRNVSVQDEFRGGGVHPAFVGSGSLQPNNQFSGYPGYSLSGETMLVGSAAYRFPIARRINQRIGPLYLFDTYAQFGGTAGNFWSYRPPEEGDEGKYYYDQFGQRVAYNESDVHREIPFVDDAYKNGNALLYDVNAEIRVSSTLFGENQWASFFRVAYGFKPVSGVGDVNGDDVQDTTETGLGDALSNEHEDPGFRFYIGLGTGW